jgi:hypothetical protein
MQGFSIVKFGMSPKDNVERENSGIKDIKKNAARKKKEDTPRQNVGEQTEQKQTRNQTDEKKVKPTEERKENVTVRKIRIIKKQ